MLRWFVAPPLILLALAAAAMAQPEFPFQAVWIYLPDSGAALTTTCDGPLPIPDGRIVRVYWDADSDGVDLTDPIAPLCDVPPQCEEGPPGTFNFNEFPMNGAAVGLGAGYFYADYGMDSHGAMPDPPRYYLRIYEPDGVNFIWTSAVKTMTSGFQEVLLRHSDWTCGSGGPQCMVRDEHE